MRPAGSPRQNAACKALLSTSELRPGSARRRVRPGTRVLAPQSRPHGRRGRSGRRSSAPWCRRFGSLTSRSQDPVHRLADLAGGPFDVIGRFVVRCEISAEERDVAVVARRREDAQLSRARELASASAEIHEARSLTALATSSAAGALAAARGGAPAARVEENPAAGVGCLERRPQAWGGTARARRGARADACPCTTPGRSGGHGPALRRRESRGASASSCALSTSHAASKPRVWNLRSSAPITSTGGARDRRPARPCCMTTSRGPRG